MAFPTSRSTVLVVEDDAALRTFYKSALLIAGFGVLTAADGIEALHRLEESQPSAMVLDLGLPRLSGQDVSRELASHPGVHDIPIVVVTGDTRVLNPADFACVLRKPVSAERLISAVQDCLPTHDRPRG